MALKKQQRKFAEKIRYPAYFLLVLLGIAISAVPQMVGVIFLAEITIMFLNARKNRSRMIKRALSFLAIFAFVAVALWLVPLLMYLSSSIDLNAYDFVSYAAFSLALLVSVLFYLRFAEGGKKSIPERLGLNMKNLTARNILIGIFLFAIIFVMELVVGIISVVTNTQISTNVVNILGGAPFWYYLFASFLSPICEETLFRGLMVPRIGILASAALFGSLHYTYGSTYGIEVIAAMIFGLLSGYAYKKTKSLYPSIVAHVIVNAITIFSTFAFLI